MPPEIDPDADEDALLEAAQGAEDDDLHQPEGEDESQDGEQVGGDEPPQGNREGLNTEPPRPGRSQERVRSALRERDETRAEIAALRAEMAAVRNRPQEPDPRALQAEQERLALMDPDQRMQYFRHQDQQRLQALEARLTFRLEDATDKAAFDALQSRNPLAARYAADVEKLIASERAAGRNVAREVALKFVIGEKMFEKAGKATTTQRKAAGARVQSQTTAPRSPGGIGRESRAGVDDVNALERSLRNVFI